MVPRDGLKTILMRLTHLGNQVRTCRQSARTFQLVLEIVVPASIDFCFNLRGPNMKYSLPSAFVLSLIQPTIAYADLGHVEELAGHAHIIGIGALVGAAALAFALWKSRKKRKEAKESDEQEVDAEREVA